MEYYKGGGFMASKTYPYVVYWHNKHHKKWQACKSMETALKLKVILQKQSINSIWIAKDI